MYFDIKKADKTKIKEFKTKTKKFKLQEEAMPDFNLR